MAGTSPAMTWLGRSANTPSRHTGTCSGATAGRTTARAAPPGPACAGDGYPLGPGDPPPPQEETHGRRASRSRSRPRDGFRRRAPALPRALDTALAGKFRKGLGDALGLTQFGVNLTRLAPGAISALRHWHTGEDEFVFVVSGEPTLVCDSGEQTLAAGHAAGFPAGSGDGHRLENRTDGDVVFLEIGTRAHSDRVHYTEDDLILDKTVRLPARRFTRRDGTPY